MSTLEQDWRGAPPAPLEFLTGTNTRKHTSLKVVGWLNPSNGVIIDLRKKEQLGVGYNYPNFSEPVYIVHTEQDIIEE